MFKMVKANISDLICSEAHRGHTVKFLCLFKLYGLIIVSEIQSNRIFRILSIIGKSSLKALLRLW